jgi:hypothetical protein
MEINPEVKEERERIKRILEWKKESVNRICEERATTQKRKKAGHNIARSKALKILDNVIYLIDNPKENPYSCKNLE